MASIMGTNISDGKLKKPFRLIIAGGSGTGKTTFLRQLVDNSHFETPFDKVVYSYPDYLTDMPSQFDQIVEYRPGLGDLNYFATLPKNSLIIFDDMMNECGSSCEMMKLFSVVARKQNISIIFIVQNIYDNSRQFRNIRLNATGMVMFNFYAASDILRRLIRDLNLQEKVPKRLLDQIYARPFAYIFIDIHPQRQSTFSVVRGNIFDRNFSIYNKMEYVAVPKSDFLKFFKIAEVRGDTVRAIKDEITIRKRRHKKRRIKKRNKRKKQRVEASESTSTSEGLATDSSASDCQYSDESEK